MGKPVILLCAPASASSRELQEHLKLQGFEVVRPDRRAEACHLFQGSGPDLAIIDSPGHDLAPDLKTVSFLRRQNRGTPIFLIARHSSEAKAVAALRAGITDYFKEPVSYGELLESIQRHLPPPGQASPPPASPEGEIEPTFIGETPPIQKIKDYIARAGAIDCNVLITGETGTGKERAAELIHWHSSRRAQPLIAINCAALPENLLEGELFGYERGAFTGAQSAYPGKLGLAEGGTVLLDEIFEMGPYMQAKILRAVDTRKIFRLGGKKAIPLNVRIVAATNQDPERAMTEGVLRSDLFYRLNVARVHLPPLRERQDDIPMLLMHFLREMNGRYGRRVEGFTSEVMELLRGYAWPGNIRELRNLVEALFINLPSRLVSLVHLPESFRPLKASLKLPRDERQQVLEALLATNWNKSQAADKLQWSRMTLYRKMQKHEISESPRRGSLK
jgi:DNA-binding NtrC family response regulator